MSHHQSGPIAATHSLAVFAADALTVTDGVNHTETIRSAETLCIGDAYTLRSQTEQLTLHIEDLSAAHLHPTFKVTGSDAPIDIGTRIAFLSRLTFMTHVGASVDVIVIACDSPASQVFLHPMGPLAPNTEYMLISTSNDFPPLPVTNLDGLSFSRGTRITTATGAQVPVEQLREGDRVLTRDNGMQPIRWIGTRTSRAAGAFAPVVIGHGTLGNAEVLIVGQTHRMLLTDWRAEVMTGSKDVLIAAADLINDKDIYLRPGGFVEYTQLVLDAHQIIYAEGVATESLHLNASTLSSLPKHAAADLLDRVPSVSTHSDTPTRTSLDHADARNFLRQIGRL